jgi:hypothetical protein
MSYATLALRLIERFLDSGSESLTIGGVSQREKQVYKAQTRLRGCVFMKG